MSQNYMRYCKLIVAGQSEAIDLSAMRIRFSIHHATNAIPKWIEARVYNLSKATAEKVKGMAELGFIQLDAGYIGNHGVIFQGNIKYVNLGRESPTDTYTDIYAGDGDVAFNFATVSKTFAAGSTPQDHYNEILNQYGKFGVTKGLVSFVDLSQPKYPRAVTLQGMATHALNTLATSKNALAYVDMGKLHIVDKGHSPQVSATDLNSATGLIGMPQETVNGIIVTALIGPQFSINTRLHINQSDINPTDPVWGTGGDYSFIEADFQQRIAALDTARGTYRVLAIDWEGDTRGVPWYVTMITIGEKGDQNYILKSTGIKDPALAEGPANSTPSIPPGSSPGQGSPAKFSY
jgi:hypothetical protein